MAIADLLFPYLGVAMIQIQLPDYWRDKGFSPQCQPIVMTSGAEDFTCD